MHGCRCTALARSTASCRYRIDCSCAVNSSCSARLHGGMLQSSASEEDDDPAAPVSAAVRTKRCCWACSTAHSAVCSACSEDAGPVLISLLPLRHQPLSPLTKNRPSTSCRPFAVPCDSPRGCSRCHDSARKALTSSATFVATTAHAASNALVFGAKSHL